MHNTHIRTAAAAATQPPRLAFTALVDYYCQRSFIVRFWFRVRAYYQQHFVKSQQTNRNDDDVIGVVTRSTATVTPPPPSASLPVARPTVDPHQHTTAAAHDDLAAADMQSSNNNNNDQSSFSSSDTDLDFHDSDSRRRRLFKAARARNCSTIRPAVGTGGMLHTHTLFSQLLRL